MKTQLSMRHQQRRGQGGSAVLVILVLLGIMLIFVAANTANLNWLRRQVNVVDQRQTQRLAQSAANQPLSK
jgi:Tfp pilus assembly protein PilX